MYEGKNFAFIRLHNNQNNIYNQLKFYEKLYK